METKVCTKCGEEKPLSEFYRLKSSKDGRRSACKKCSNESDLQYRLANPERRKVWKKEWDLNNQDHIQEYNEKNKERDAKRISAWHKQNREIHGDELNTKKREWDKNNPEHIKEYRRREDVKQGRRKIQKQNIDELTDTYVIGQLHSKKGYSFRYCRENPILIESKRAVIQMKRTKKIIKNGNDSKS